MFYLECNYWVFLVLTDRFSLLKLLKMKNLYSSLKLYMKVITRLVAESNQFDLLTERNSLVSSLHVIDSCTWESSCWDIAIFYT